MTPKERKDDLKKFINKCGGEEAAAAKLQEAIDQMEAVLNKPETPEVMRMTAKQDQFAARLRDMTEEEREIAIKNIEESTDLTLEEVRDWVNRLIGKTTI